MLSKIGYRFDFDKLEDWEVEAYSLISKTFADEEEKDFKKASKRK